MSFRQTINGAIAIAGGHSHPIVKFHKRCRECGVDFTSEIPSQLTCSPNCAAKRKKLQRAARKSHL